MKNIYFGLLATLLFCNFSFAQLISDEKHRTMMNDYGNMVNYILRNQAGANADLNLIKRQIVNGEFWLSEQTKTSIIIYADSLKIYGSQFAAAKGLTANTDALKYFYSSFAPSTVIQNGKLIESTTSAGLTATEMWTCALETFGTDSCGSSVLVSDKSNLSTLATTSVNKLTAVAGNIGVLVMLDGFDYCLNTRIKPELFDFVGQAHNEALAYTYSTVISKISNYTFNDIKNSNDYYFTHLHKYSDGINANDSYVNENFVNNIIFQVENNYPLSYGLSSFTTAAKYYMDKLGTIVNQDFGTAYSNNTITQIKIWKINDLNREIARSNLNDFEVSTLYMASSIGKSSLQYWNNNSEAWNYGQTTARWLFFKKAWADIKGFIQGVGLMSTEEQIHAGIDIATASGKDGLLLTVGLIKLYNDIKGPLACASETSSFVGKK